MKLRENKWYIAEVKVDNFLYKYVKKNYTIVKFLGYTHLSDRNQISLEIPSISFPFKHNGYTISGNSGKRGNCVFVHTYGIKLRKPTKKEYLEKIYVEML